jgi:hypothetical protein
LEASTALENTYYYLFWSLSQEHSVCLNVSNKFSKR